MPRGRLAPTLIGPPLSRSKEPEATEQSPEGVSVSNNQNSNSIIKTFEACHGDLIYMREWFRSESTRMVALMALRFAHQQAKWRRDRVEPKELPEEEIRVFQGLKEYGAHVAAIERSILNIGNRNALACSRNDGQPICFLSQAESVQKLVQDSVYYITSDPYDSVRLPPSFTRLWLV